MDFKHTSAHRIMPESLAVGGLYVLYTRLITRDPRKATAKDIALITGEPRIHRRSAHVNFDLLDDDLNSRDSIKGKFKKGLWVDAYKWDRPNSLADSGFFRPYIDEMQIRLDQLIGAEIEKDSLIRPPEFDKPFEEPLE